MNARLSVETAQDSFLAAKNRLTKNYHQLKEVTSCNEQIKSWLDRMESQLLALTKDEAEITDLADRKVHLEKLKEIELEVSEWKGKLCKVQKFAQFFEDTLDAFGSLDARLEAKIQEQLSGVQRHEEFNASVDSLTTWSGNLRGELAALSSTENIDVKHYKTFLENLLSKRDEFETDVKQKGDVLCQISSPAGQLKVKSTVEKVFRKVGDIASEAGARIELCAEESSKPSEISTERVSPSDNLKDFAEPIEVETDIANEGTLCDKENSSESIEITEETSEDAANSVISWLNENKDLAFDNMNHSGVQSLEEFGSRLSSTLSSGQSLIQGLSANNDITKDLRNECATILDNLAYDLEAVNEILPICQDLASIRDRVDSATEAGKDDLKEFLDEVTDKKFELADLEKATDALVQVACDMANSILVDVNVKIQEAVIAEGQAEAKRLEKLREVESQCLAAAFDGLKSGDYKEGVDDENIESLDDSSERSANLKAAVDIIKERSASNSRKQVWSLTTGFHFILFLFLDKNAKKNNKGSADYEGSEPRNPGLLHTKHICM